MTNAPAAQRARTALWALPLLLVLLAARLPSLTQPAGNDQSLYMYVADRVLEGGVPYVDAWDQKPPAVFFAYALLRALWPHASVAAVADIVTAALVAWGLVILGRRTTSPGVGVAAAALFLLFSHPSLSRLSGVYIRGQCEAFIVAAVTLALVLVSRPGRDRWSWGAAGVALGAAFWFKYNALAYVLPVVLGAWFLPGGRGPAERGSTLKWIGGGFVLASAVPVAYFWWHGALTELRLATIDYNLTYSGETYPGGLGWALSYVAMLPVHRARADMLWFLGGLGALGLAATGRRHVGALAAVVLSWLLAAVVSIAVNGARDLPQYFVQAGPALALAAATGLALMWRQGVLWRAVAGLVLILGMWRVGVEPPSFAGLRWGGLPQLAGNIAFDIGHLAGRIDRATYLARFKGTQKYDALAVAALAERARQTTAPDEPILVFGFAPGVYVESGRRSASRFFWSRPVVVGFAADRPRYGPDALLDELEAAPPAFVALQKRDWEPDAMNSMEFFDRTEPLRAWLAAHYTLEDDTPVFSVWRRLFQP